MSIDWTTPRVQRLDDPLLAYQADADSAEAEVYERLARDLEALPDRLSRRTRIRFFLGDCAWRARRLLSS